MMSIYSIKQAQSCLAPWSDIVPVGKNIRNLYDSLGDVTISTPTQVATLIDGPEKVVRYGNLVLSSTLTAANRCKGLTVICDNLTVQSGGVLSMTGKGARVLTNDDPFFPFTDFLIPDQVTLSSSLISKAQALAIIRAQGFAPWDQGTWQALVNKLFGFNLAVSQQGQAALLTVSGCGAGAAGRVISGTDGTYAGTVGNAGANGGMGGGGGPACRIYSGGYRTAPPSGDGCPHSGGSGVGSVHADGTHVIIPSLASRYSGQGGNGGGTTNTGNPFAPWIQSPYYQGDGGAGNPGGLAGPSGYGGNPGNSGTGGKLVVICYGAVNIQAGGKIEANGVQGGNGSIGCQAGAGGSGGGHVSLVYGNTCTNSGTIQAAGGAGGVGSYISGGSGGAGCVVTKSFTQMGTAW